MTKTSLLDSKGNAIAYIADDKDATIYMWNGEAVAYLKGEHVYGFNGEHLGWFEDGIIRDGSGAQIGFTKEKCPSVKKTERVKSVKKVKQIKAVKKIAPVRPINKLNISNIQFEDFLLAGKK